VLKQARKMSETEAIAALGEWALPEMNRKPSS